MILQVHAAAEPAGVHLEVAGDAVAPVGVTEDDEVLGQPGLILVEAANLDRSAGAAARRQEPVAVGQRTRFDVLDLGSGGAGGSADRERHDAPAIEEEQPADGTAEQQLAAAVLELRVPVHLLGERQIAQQAGEDVGQRVNGAAAALVLLIGEVFALGRLRARQLLERHALLLGEAERRGRRLAVLPEGRRHGRAGDRLVEIVLAFRDVRRRARSDAGAC